MKIKCIIVDDEPIAISVIEKHIDTIRDKLKKEIQECIRIQDKHCRPINTKEKDWKNRVKETLKGGKYDWAHVEKAIHKRIYLFLIADQQFAL